jgi:hypothetical protein
MNDFLAFRRMVAPVIIQVLFWIGTALCIIAGLVAIGGAELLSARGGPSAPLAVLGGIAYLILGPLVVRIYCEILIVVFRMNETLTEIRNSLGSRQG